MKSRLIIASGLLSTVFTLGACAPTSPTASNTSNLSQADAKARFSPIDVDNVPVYAIKPTKGAVSISGQLRVPANLILSNSELSSITAPPLGITAPPLGVTAPPLGITAPPLGLMPAQPIFGIKSEKSSGQADKRFSTFFSDNFSMALGGTRAFINKTVLQTINGQHYFIASYVVPEVKANQSLTLTAEHPFLSLTSTVLTGDVDQTLASDLDFGTTAVDLVKAAAKKAGKSIDFAYLNQNLAALERVSTAMQQRFKNELPQAELDQFVSDFVSNLPEAAEPVSIQIQGGEQAVSLKKGGIQLLSATTQFSNEGKSQATWWRSSQGDVVNVLSDGTIIGVKPGKATIYAMAVDHPGVVDSISIEVK